MSLHIGVCPFHLLFKHPFGTTHGVRTGTDCVFVRLEQNGVFGYGEATMPPYVPENQRSVVAVLRAVDFHGIDLPSGLNELLGRSSTMVSSDPCARAAIITAAYDLVGKLTDRSVYQVAEVPEPAGAKAMFTLGICALADIPLRLAELPECEVLKVKLDGIGDIERTTAINRLWKKKLFLDINQGWQTRKQATSYLSAIEGIELAGIEQPYLKDDLALNRWLQHNGSTTVYADESVQGLKDMLERASGFGGVNVKLMKCGGLDQARQMIDKAKASGQRVMLGSMSESSLGCTAAAHLSGLADLVDLDGPWLISNDPFKGIGVHEGRMHMPVGNGLGVVPDAELQFVPISA